MSTSQLLPPAQRGSRTVSPDKKGPRTRAGHGEGRAHFRSRARPKLKGTSKNPNNKGNIFMQYFLKTESNTKKKSIMNEIPTFKIKSGQERVVGFPGGRAQKGGSDSLGQMESLIMCKKTTRETDETRGLSSASHGPRVHAALGRHLHVSKPLQWRQGRGRQLPLICRHVWLSLSKVSVLLII